MIDGQNVESLQKVDKNHYNKKQKKMAQILAGTAFGQVLCLPLNVPKPNQKIVKYGIMKKQPIISIQQLPSCQESTFYASGKGVYTLSNDALVFDNKHSTSKIIGIQQYGKLILAALNNGSLVSIGIDSDGDWEDKEILAGKFEPSIKQQYNKVVSDRQGSYCLIGKEVLPFLFDSVKNLVAWKGKNVPNDELDLRVPVNDTDATFFKNRSCLACAHADSKIRVYDVRTNKQKPSADYHLKLQKVYTKASLTNIRVSTLNDNMFCVSNDLGAIYQCDIRYQMRVSGKFKGINSTVSDILVHQDKLYAGSLDSYVRVYNLETKQLQEKHYMNKPIYSIRIKEGKGEQAQDFKQEELSEQQYQPELNSDSKKVKKLRKRNKVNLKYLKPVDWDQVPINQQLLKQKQQEYQEINSKDADSYLEEEGNGVKDEHRSDQERDSDLD